MGSSVNIRDILDARWVVPQLLATDKEQALGELSEALCSGCEDVSASSAEVLQAVMAREQLASTGVGDGVAIPHAKIAGLNRLVACFGRHSPGIAFDAIDAMPVQLIFLLLIPVNSAGPHLKALARISRLLKDSSLRQRLLTEEGPGLYRTLVEEDAPH